MPGGRGQKAASAPPPTRLPSFLSLAQFFGVYFVPTRKDKSTPFGKFCIVAEMSKWSGEALDPQATLLRGPWAISGTNYILIYQ